MMMDDREGRNEGTKEERSRKEERGINYSIEVEIHSNTIQGIIKTSSSIILLLSFFFYFFFFKDFLF